MLAYGVTCNKIRIDDGRRTARSVKPLSGDDSTPLLDDVSGEPTDHGD